MKSSKNALEKAIQELLKPYGFKRKDVTWYLPKEKHICLINLQKSDWGDKYYINIAIYIRELGPVTSGEQKNINPTFQPISIEYPKEHKTHIRARLDRFMSNSDIELFRKHLDFEDTSMTHEEKIKEIISAIELYAIPFFLSIKTLDDIKRYIEEGKLRGFLVGVGVRDLLGIYTG